MENQQMRKMMNGAIILSAAAFIAKILSAVYRVPFQNMVGNSGFYVYQQIYPIYGIAMTVALSGFPIFLSKLVAEASTLEEQKSLLKKSFVLLSILSGVFFLGIYFSALLIANLMGDANLEPIIKTVSWLFLLIPFLAVSRGYFQGTFRMLPTAISQVGEQFVRVAVILIAAYVYTRNQWDEYQMGTVAMSSSWIAGLVACIILSVALYKQQPLKVEEQLKVSPVADRLKYKSIAKRFATEGITMCLLSALLILMQLIDSFTLYNGLIENGLNSFDAKNLKGIYDRGQPLVQLGMVVATAFSASWIPLLSQSFAQRNKKSFARAAKSLVRITATFAMAATTGMIVLMPYLNLTLFGDTDGNLVLSLYSVAILFASFIGAYNAIFQSQNKHKVALIGLLIGLGVKIVLNEWFVEHYGTLGSSGATVISLVTILMVMHMDTSKEVKESFVEKSFGWKLLFSCGVMAMLVWLEMQLIGQSAIIEENRLAAFGSTVIGGVTGIGVFLWLIIKCQLLTLREWLSLPFGKKILRKQAKWNGKN
ncbi:MAG: polysaccharide biosynthesis protein [Carnobacterium jeotgali]|uniref:putative polysaccharide biosynthesis protein n=1 Tax=Carnobacterium jeotgali TaxID=545534 RepID=UPI0004939DD1|nr:polysaccharide biosynthesis protein [Carnobacterium jeotgali]